MPDDKSYANGNGASTHNGPSVPLWLRSWEYQLAKPVTFWDFQ